MNQSNNNNDTNNNDSHDNNNNNNTYAAREFIEFMQHCGVPAFSGELLSRLVACGLSPAQHTPEPPPSATSSQRARTHRVTSRPDP